MKTKLYEGKEVYFNDKGKKLISFSGATKPFTEYKFLQIPKSVLDKATKFGLDFMQTLYAKLCGRTDTETECNVNGLIKKLQELKVKPVKLERHIYNDIWHGYLDIDCEDCFIEIKTRSEAKLELTTVVQCEVYKKITGKNYHILYVLKKTGECVELKPDLIMLHQSGKIINAIEFLFNTL